MAITEAHFLETRAAQLAAVFLTRHSDLAVAIEPRPDYGLDLMVSLLDGGESVGRLLGVEVKAVSPTTSLRMKESALGQASRQVRPALAQIPFPVCLFVFTMEDDRGYWRWVRKPAFASDVPHGLLEEQDLTLAMLDNEAITSLLETTRAWYR